MKLTGKCKTDFEKWYKAKQHKPNFLKDEWLDSCCAWFYSTILSDSMRYGVYVDFFVSKCIHINITHDTYKDGVNILFQVFEYDNTSYDNWSDNSTGLYGDNGDYTLQEAREQAIIKANEIYNN